MIDLLSKFDPLIEQREALLATGLTDPFGLVMFGVEDVGRDKRIGRGQPAFPIGRAIIRYDQVEIEHQPVELALPEARSVEQHRPRRARILRCDRFGERRLARIDLLRQFLGDQLPQRCHV